MAEPLVSVLTPSFDQAVWLRDNLSSVASQTYPAVEHVVVDGGSTDGSVEILENADHRLVWVSEPDRGQSHALNKALSMSSGSLIGWLNSDDVYYSADAVAAVVAVFDAEPEVDVVYGHAAVVDASGRPRFLKWAPRIDHGRILLGDWLVQPAVFLRRSAIGEVMANEDFKSTMDRELWLRLGPSATFRRIDKVLAADRHHPARKSLDFSTMRRDIERAAEMYGAPRTVPAAVRRRILGAAFLLAGIPRLGELAGPRAFPGPPPDLRIVFGRQLLEAARHLVPLPWRKLVR